MVAALGCPSNPRNRNALRFACHAKLLSSFQSERKQPFRTQRRKGRWQARGFAVTVREIEVAVPAGGSGPRSPGRAAGGAVHPSRSRLSGIQAVGSTRSP
jgi:hypothetical protein